MAFVIGIGGFFILALITLGAVISRRDRRAGRAERDAGDMWRDEVREHRRDVRAAGRMGYTYQDARWTRQHQRGQDR